MDTEQHRNRVYQIFNAPSLGTTLRELRLLAGLSQTVLAEQLGIDRSYLSELECGKETEQLKRLFAILRTLDARLLVEGPEWR